MILNHSLAPHHTRNHLLLFGSSSLESRRPNKWSKKLFFVFTCGFCGLQLPRAKPACKASQISLAASFTLIVFDLRNRVKLPQEAVKNIANPTPTSKKIARTHPPEKKYMYISYLNITLKKYKTTYNKTKNAKKLNNPKRSITK